MVLRLQVEYSMSCNFVANLLVELFCGIMELLVEMNGQLTERRETECVEKNKQTNKDVKYCID